MLLLDTIPYIAEQMLVLKPIPFDKKLAVVLIKSAFYISLSGKRSKRVTSKRMTSKRFTGKRKTLRNF